jgi:hypothetical protein
LSGRSREKSRYKKSRQSCWRLFLFGSGRLQPSLPIRQRCGFAKEVKVKLSGHGGEGQGWGQLEFDFVSKRGIYAALRDRGAGNCANTVKISGRGDRLRDREASL